MAVRIKKGAALSSLSLTPLIDVVFLLLIFFLVASRFAQEDQVLDVALPRASEAKPLIVQPRELFVNIDKEGRYFINGAIMEADEVEAVLVQAVANNPANQSVIIRADERVPFGRVVVVENLCKKTGVQSFREATAGEED